MANRRRKLMLAPDLINHHFGLPCGFSFVIGKQKRKRLGKTPSRFLAPHEETLTALKSED
jgi:hypothetical protein